jgi:hypothetical protein
LSHGLTFTLEETIMTKLSGTILDGASRPEGRGAGTGPRTATQPSHPVGTREQWLAARLELLEAEKELTRRSDELARRRQALPWIRIGKEYRFETEEGSASLADLFHGRSQLLVYHFMFGPDYTAGCLSCSAIADGFNGFVVHLANHDVTLCAVSRAPLPKLLTYRQRMGWTFPRPVTISTPISTSRLPRRNSGRVARSTTIGARTGSMRYRIPSPVTRTRTHVEPT